MLPPGHWKLKLKICWLLHANNIMCKFDAEIKPYKDGKTICIYHNHYLPCTYNSKRFRFVCNCYYYDRAVHISVAVDMRTLLDGNHFFSCSSNGQVAAYRVTGPIIKRLWYNVLQNIYCHIVPAERLSYYDLTYQFFREHAMVHW